MSLDFNLTYTAFAGHQKIATGNLFEVAQAVKEHQETESLVNVLIFDNANSKQIELDLRGTKQDVQQWLSAQAPKPALKSRRGRPKLGVVAREITLLPRHWEWLKQQPGSTSATLRKLVDEARKQNRSQDILRNVQSRVHGFMTAIAGDLANYEDALRALYAADLVGFNDIIASWPLDIREHIAILMATGKEHD